MSDILIIVIVAIVLFALAKGASDMAKVLSHWHHRFDTIPFTTQEFYASVEAEIVKKQIHITPFRISYGQGGMLSPRREYLRIRYKEFIYDICAAPFGTGYFVSWWLGETGQPIRDFFINLPVVGRFFTKRPKTFYELDTEVMFKEIVSSCVRHSIDQLNQSKGMRMLTDADWKEYNRQY